MKKPSYFLSKEIIVWICILVLSRLLPHPPNMTPLVNLSLFSGQKLARRWAVFVIFSSLFISDILLAKIKGYPAFGFWQFFTYSGVLVIVFLGAKMPQQGAVVARVPAFANIASYDATSQKTNVFVRLIESLRIYWRTLAYVFSASLIFWLWTNFGVWLFSGLYSLTLQGFLSCYIVALPFLRNALCGDFIWFLVVFGIFDRIYKKFLQAKVAKWQTRWI